MRLNQGKGRLRRTRKAEDFSPMEGVGNMADAMLVFACGLIVALILSWNVDVSEQGTINQRANNKYEVEGMDNGQEQEIEVNKDLQEMGKVVYDPETGKYYVIEE